MKKYLGRVILLVVILGSVGILYFYSGNNENANVRSSSYMNVLSINSQNQKTIIAHEFGHNFAYLADEYVPAKLPRKARNCVASCEKFSDKKDGCFEGCSKENYFRSVNSGIMKSLLSNDYGLFNEIITFLKY